MICLTGAEQTVAALARRLEQHPAVDLQEVRLDLLRDLDEGVYPLLRSPRLVVTCRAPAQGGGFTGTESERLAVLRRALEQQPGYLDLELTCEEQAYLTLYRLREQTQIIHSHHCGATEALPPVAARLSRRPAELLKLAVAVDDAAQLATLRRLLPEERRPVLCIGMGAAGLLSRVLYRRFGSPWTYVATEEDLATAPGQLSLARATRWRVAQAQAFRPLGLIGGAQIGASPGPSVYNRLFALRDLPHLYLPVQTARPADCLALLEQLGFAGCSVTMPAKEQLLGAVDTLSEEARRAGALNTVCFNDGGRAGHNSDVIAIARLLESRRGQPALILGAGGAARAAVVALQQLGCPITLCARQDASAGRLATAFGIAHAPWAERERQNASLVINATPCGSDGCSLPLTPRGSWTGRLLLDMVLAPVPTPLLQQVSSRGGQTLAGWQMWVEQGSLQLAWLIGGHSRPAELAALYHEGQEPAHD